jgi:phospholipid-binding lipoprotein MlaA
MKKDIFLFYILAFFLFIICGCAANKNVNNTISDFPDPSLKLNENSQLNSPTEDIKEDPFISEEKKSLEDEFKEIPDPFESYNRFMFAFNDKLYFYFLKPVSKGYKKLVHESVRMKVGNFYSNAKMPVRLLNCLFQAKGKGVTKEFGRFTINSTFGLVGFFDVAGSCFKLEPTDEDSDQTLGSYGIGPGFYLVLPFFGPSSLRGSFGLIFDSAMNPINYILVDPFVLSSLEFHERINFISLHIGEYENFKREAIEPYAALRDAYFQNIQSKIKE